jgi:hypothetical protein
MRFASAILLLALAGIASAQPDTKAWTASPQDGVKINFPSEPDVSAREVKGVKYKVWTLNTPALGLSVVTSTTDAKIDNLVGFEMGSVDSLLKVTGSFKKIFLYRRTVVGGCPSYNLARTHPTVSIWPTASSLTDRRSI